MIRSSGDASSLRGRTLLIAAAFFWSLSGVLIKSPTLASLPPTVLGCFRALIAAACLFPLVRPAAIRFRPALIPMVLGFASMNVLFITAMTQTTAAAAIFLQYTSTAWAFVFGIVFLQERIERGNVVALLFALLGITWIVAADWHGERFLGNLIALGSGLSYAVVIVCLRQLRDESPAWLVALNHLVSGLVLLPWGITFATSLSRPQWGMMAVLGTVQMALPYVLFARSFRYVTAQEAGLFTLLEPILNPLWVWIFWGERVEAPTWIGGSLILMGLLLRSTVFRTAPVAAKLASEKTG